MTNLIGFYRVGTKRLIAVCQSSMVPPVGGLISIRKETFQVSAVTYVLDNSDYPAQSRMRANVTLVDPEKSKALNPEG